MTSVFEVWGRLNRKEIVQTKWCGGVMSKNKFSTSIIDINLLLMKVFLLSTDLEFSQHLNYNFQTTLHSWMRWELQRSLLERSCTVLSKSSSVTGTSVILAHFWPSSSRPCVEAAAAGAQAVLAPLWRASLRRNPSTSRCQQGKSLKARSTRATASTRRALCAISTSSTEKSCRPMRRPRPTPSTWPLRGGKPSWGALEWTLWGIKVNANGTWSGSMPAPLVSASCSSLWRGMDLETVSPWAPHTATPSCTTIWQALWHMRGKEAINARTSVAHPRTIPSASGSLDIWSATHRSMDTTTKSLLPLSTHSITGNHSRCRV